MGIFTFRVLDIERAYNDCVSLGVAVESPPIDINGVKMFFIHDPDGVRIELLALPNAHVALAS